MNEILSHIPEIICALLGGGVVSAFTVPELKRGKRAEVAREELTNAKMLIEEYVPMLKSIKEENEALRKEVEDLRQKVAKQSATIAELRTKQHTMELIAQEDKALRCEITTCVNRKPPFKKENLELLAKTK